MKRDRSFRAEAEHEGGAESAVDAVRHVLQGDTDLDVLSPEEAALLTSQLTGLVERAKRVRSLGRAYAGVDVSPSIKELLRRLEAGSSLVTGVH